MSNLTRQEGIVRPTTSLFAPAGSELVVFKRRGTSLEFRQILQPGERFKIPLLEKQASFVAFRVKRDSHLRYQFERACTTMDGVYTFHVQIGLSYSVGDIDSVINQLDSDPLRRVVEYVGDMICDRVRRLDWDTIKTDHEVFEREILQRWRDNQGAIGNCLDRVQVFAQPLGIALSDITIARTLADEHIAVERKRDEVATEIQLSELDRHLVRQRQGHDDEDRQRDGRIQVIDTATSAVTGMLERASKNVDSFTGLKGATRDLTQILQSVAPPPSYPATMASPHGAAALPPAGHNAMPQLTAGEHPDASFASGVLRLLAEQFNEIAHLDADERAAMTASILHLVAEVLHDDTASGERLTEYSERLEEQINNAGRGRAFERAQRRQLRRLLDLDTLTSELRGGR